MKREKVIKDADYKKEMLIKKINLMVLFLAIAVSMLSLTYAWFSENYNADTNAVTISGQYITTLYFDNFERYQLDIDNNYSGQSGLGTEGTPTEPDLPYRVRFLITITVDNDSPIPLEILYEINSITIKKPFSEIFELTQEQINNNFKLYLLNPTTEQPDNIVNETDRTEEFILVIQYYGENDIPFEFSGEEYIGSEFTFAINVCGGIVYA